jgi:uncharacterized protein (TIGR02449 family)
MLTIHYELSTDFNQSKISKIVSRGQRIMEDVLSQLENRIKSLVLQCDQLKQANLKLKQSKLLLMREKEMLIAKHKVAITQIEHMVSRLKSLESTQ